MKNLSKMYKQISFAFLSLFMSIIAFAQDKKVNVDINTNPVDGGGNFFASPWVWVIGAAIFILLLVALMRGGNKNA